MFLKNTVCFFVCFLKPSDTFWYFFTEYHLISIPTPDRPSFVSNTWGKTWGESAKWALWPIQGSDAIIYAVQKQCNMASLFLVSKGK